MRPRILLTGFKPFPGVEVNPTEKLMQTIAQSPGQLPGVSIETLVLDTAYDACEQQLADTVATFEPDAILSFGVNTHTDQLHLERIAINIDDAKIPDTHGNERRGQKIVAGGPVGYETTMPIEEMLQALQERGIPAETSNHAGTYVCNHLFYYGLHLIEQLQRRTLMGFIHVPAFPEQLKAGGKAKKGLDIETLLGAARICVAVIAGYLGTFER